MLNPRDKENLGVMACWHKRYILGDTRVKRFANTPAEEWLEPWGMNGLRPKEWLASLPKGSIVLPVFMYDHSGLTVKTSPFSCPWDSGQLGNIVATPAAMKKYFKKEWLRVVTKRLALERLEQEVQEYDQYLQEGDDE